jgi:hypothetical protein
VPRQRSVSIGSIYLSLGEKLVLPVFQGMDMRLPRWALGEPIFLSFIRILCFSYDKNAVPEEGLFFFSHFLLIVPTGLDSVPSPFPLPWI